MSQQINLLNRALIQKRDLVTPNNLLLAAVLLVAAMSGLYLYTQIGIASLKQQREQATSTLASVQAQLKQTALLHTPRKENMSLKEKIGELELLEKQKNKTLKLINKSSASVENSYAELMTAFSRQIIDGLWLTGFTMDSDHNTLDISGRSIQAELVPEYITRLADEPALKGKSFETFSMGVPAHNPSKPEAADNAAPSGSQPTTQHNHGQVKNAPAIPEFIEFSLQSRNKVRDVAPENTSQAGGQQ